MNHRRVVVAAVVTWAVSLVVGFVVNDIVLANIYAANQAVMRPEAQMTGMLPIGFVFLLLGFLAFAYMYAKGYEGGSGLMEGMRFGLCVGILVTGFGLIWQYVLYPITGPMAAAIIIDQLVESTFYGAIVGLIYKPAAHAVRRPATV
ncbi:MAG: hypothetical protein ACRD1Q_18330 [Vicinamibacterales bacterium]